MKIALVLETWDPGGGGLEQWAAQLASRLRRRGHAIVVVAFRAAPDAPREGLRLLRWSANRLDRAADAAAALADIDADVVHDLGVGWRYDVIQPPMGSRIANRARDLASLPWPDRWRRRIGPAGRRWMRDVRALETRQYGEGDGLVLAVSRRVADDLAALHGVAADRLRLVPNGVDVDRYVPARDVGGRDALRARVGAGPGVPLVLFAARNPRLKGLPALIAAVARLEARGRRLHVAAIGHEPDAAIRREVARHRAHDLVSFVGSVPDPLPWYAAADLFALPTWYDACSLTVLEACACGLPAITTRWNGAAELLTDGQDGFLVDGPEDIDALSAALDRAGAPAERARVGAAARVLALRHTLDANVDAVERAYDAAIERRRTRRRTSAPASRSGSPACQDR